MDLVAMVVAANTTLKASTSHLGFLDRSLVNLKYAVRPRTHNVTTMVVNDRLQVPL